MEASMQAKVRQLINKGVIIPNPESVEIGAEVDVDNISGEGVHIHNGCKLYGRSTRIGDQTRLGTEAPVTIQNCQIGPQVALKGGFFKESVFLEKSSAGSGSHVREGCLFEEEANIAHTVGLKQTILFPFVTLGSLINFCDCLMAGGTSRKNHSEVGSSYIHFNFTPNQDKATPSLIGDVPLGVMLDQSPIFLGGQGGLVGPCRIAYGTIAAAGTILRKDVLRANRMIIETSGKGGSVPYVPGRYRVIKRIVHNNLFYIGNLIALMQWYQHVRSQYTSERFPEYLCRGGQQILQFILNERVERLYQLAEKMDRSIQNYMEKMDNAPASKLLIQQQELHDNKDILKEKLQALSSYSGDEQLRDQFLNNLINKRDINRQSHIETIQSLATDTKKLGSTWLQSIVDHMLQVALEVIPSFR
jgi:UDP-N-acetylglucosamine/UDP-N-acetylgalactosamine diphosphorylase